jgi:nitroreductase
MDILDAVRARHSVRDFLPTPLPEDLVMKILETAAYSPSGGNSQPWELFVASGATLEKIRCEYLERAYNAPAAPGRPGGGNPPPETIRERMATIRNERMQLLGLDPADPEAGRVMMQFGARMYGAPVVVVICMEKALSSNFDLGLLTQTICLVAQGYGVDSMIAAGLVAHRDVLRQELEIPENLEIVIGIGLGYANPKHIINTYRSPRRPIQEVVRHKG